MCAEQDEAIASLATLYAANGLKMMVLKGGLSLDYPYPNHRPSGGIDTYNFGQQQESNEMVEKLGIKVDREHRYHTVFIGKGQMVA